MFELFQYLARDVLTKSIIITLLFVITLILTKLVKDFIKNVSKKTKIDNKIKIGNKISFTEILTNFVILIIYLVFITSVVEIVDIRVLTEYFKMLTNFVINIFSGIIILILSYGLAIYIKRKIIETKLDNSKLIAEIVFIFVMLIAIQISLKIVGVPTNLLESIILIIIASIGLGVAIAIGLGLKDIVSEFAKKNFKS